MDDVFERMTYLISKTEIKNLSYSIIDKQVKIKPIEACNHHKKCNHVNLG